MGAPSYEVAEGVECVAPNALVGVRGEWEKQGTIAIEKLMGYLAEV